MFVVVRNMILTLSDENFKIVNLVGYRYGSFPMHLQLLKVRQLTPNP
jgi:hypothetical protein